MDIAGLTIAVFLKFSTSASISPTPPATRCLNGSSSTGYTRASAATTSTASKRRSCHGHSRNRFWARPAQDVSNEAFNYDEFGTNVYRHPARQGVPVEGFRKQHDIYAFGGLLLEIGLWTVVTDLFTDASLMPEAIWETLVKNVRARLGHFMRQRYRDAVLFCLEGTLSVGEGDDEMQTKLIMAFKEKVLDVLQDGRKLL